MFRGPPHINVSPFACQHLHIEYQNVTEYTERPSEDVIAHPDMVEGFLDGERPREQRAERRGEERRGAPSQGRPRAPSQGRRLSKPIASAGKGL